MKRLLEVLKLAQSFLEEKSVPGARLSAEHLLAHVLHLDRLGLYLNFERPLAEEELAAYRELIRRRGAHEPLQYILGSTAFRGLDFRTGPGVLVPRPETEMLVDLVLARLGESPPSPSAIRVLDLCSGSGVIALSLAAERAGLECVLSDISPAALAYAGMNSRFNAEKLKSRVTFCACDLFEAFRPEPLFDCIVANPPYVSPSEMTALPEEIRLYEPKLALEGGGIEGVSLIGRIIEQAPRWLRSGGLLGFEIGETQREAVLRLFELNRYSYSNPEIHPDLAGKDRFALACRK